MKKYLITTTLLDNYIWFENAPASWKERAFKGLMETLTRAPFNPTPEIQRGIDFEAKINKLVNGSRETFIEQMGENCEIFYDVCKGAVQQKKLRREILIDGWCFQLYGKADYWFPTLTIDAKTTGNYEKGAKKYLDKTQHLLYAYMSEQPRFKYLVAVFDDPEDGPLATSPTRVAEIDTTVDIDEAEAVIRTRIRSCISFIRNDADIKKAYLEKFNWN